MKKTILSAMKRTTSYFVLALALGACGKLNLGETTITGTVTNLTTNSPETGRQVHLIEYESTAGPLSPLVKTIIETTTTNAQGQFSFEADLSRRNKYDYEVEFDTEDKNYKPHQWKGCGYESVAMKADLEVGELNGLELKIIPNSNISLGFVNTSNEQMNVLATLSTAICDSEVFFRNISSQESIDLDDPLPFPAGEALLTWTINHGSVTETFIQEVNLIHDEVLEVVFTYPN